MPQLRIVIVEDEPVTARNLAHVLQTIDSGITIAGMHPSVEDAVEWFGANCGSYDLVFMDIKLSDALSFDIFKQADIQTPVIFVTAYNDYGITAFKNNGIDYILKPFEPAEVEQALNKFKKLTSGRSNSITTDQLALLLEQIGSAGRTYKKSFLVHYRDKLLPVEAAAISFFYTAHEIVHAYTYDDKAYVIDLTLDILAQQLDPELFFKANRQFIVNRKAIVEVDFYFNGRLSLKLKTETPEKILVSKARVPEFKKWADS
jgi:two-component system response regulator LytT